MTASFQFQGCIFFSFATFFYICLHSIFVNCITKSKNGISYFVFSPQLGDLSSIIYIPSVNDMFLFSKLYVEFLRFVFSNKSICILKVVKLVPIVQGLLGHWCQESLFLCKFGIDFAFYNLARCLAWLGSCLCPSLNIFGLKTGSLGWRKDTNRIYIFTTRQSGGLRAGEGELVRHLQLSCRTKHPQLSNIPTPSFLRILACMKIDTGFILHRPRISLHSPHLQPQPPQAPRRAPIMHAADRFKQQVGLPALKWFPGVLICRGLYSGVHNIDITPMYGIPRYIPTHTITIQPAKPTMHESCRAGLRIQTSDALWRYLAIIPDYRQFFSDICTFLHAPCAWHGRQATMHLE